MAPRRKLLVIPLGILAVVLLVGAGMFTGLIQSDTPDGDVWHVESYPVAPEKPTLLNSLNVADYTVTYEERLFYNDLLASHNHTLHDDENVISNCRSLSVSNDSTDGFHVQLECRGGVTDSSQLAGSEEFTYSVTYRVTNNTTQQTEFQNYPFGTDRTFNSERNQVSSSR